MSNKPSKKLVIFYSLDGNTKFMAKSIAKCINADMQELKVKNAKKHKGFLKYFLGGMQVLFKIRPELLPLEKDPYDYDIIFFGTPVWASSYASPLNTFFSTACLKNKKIALFCCYASQAGKTFINMKNQLKNNQIIDEIGFKTPLKNNTSENKDKITKWAKNIIEG